MNYERHELSEIGLDMPAEELTEMTNSVKEYGFIDPVILIYDDKIVDGWHRYNVALDTETTDQLVFHEIDDYHQAVRICEAKQLHRKHLTSIQRAAIKVQYENARHLDKDGNLVLTGKRVTKKDIADQTQTSVNSVSKLAKLSEENLQKVAQGSISLNKAVEQEKQNPENLPEWCASDFEYSIIDLDRNVAYGLNRVFDPEKIYGLVTLFHIFGPCCVIDKDDQIIWHNLENIDWDTRIDKEARNNIMSLSEKLGFNVAIDGLKELGLVNTGEVKEC